MADGGFTPDESDAEPDHVGSELAFMAHLCGAEADALRDGLDTTVARLQSMQRAFLRLHLLRWLPALVVAIETVDAGLYAAAARLALDLGVDHLGGPPLDEPLASVPDILSREKTGMRQIEIFSPFPERRRDATPRRSGTSDGRRTSPQASESGMLLENLLQSAIRNGRLPLLTALDAHLGAGFTHLQGLPGGTPWAVRVEECRAMVSRIADAAADPSVAG